MRYSAIFVDSVDKWAVVDTLSDDFVPAFYDSEPEAGSLPPRKNSSLRDPTGRALLQVPAFSWGGFILL